MRRQTLGCQAAHPEQTRWEHWTLLIHPSSTGLHCPNDAPLKKSPTDEGTGTDTDTPTLLTLPQAYIPESDVKLHLTSVLPQRFPVRHLPNPETKRSLEPHKPLDPNLSKDARSTRSVVPRLIH
ncbi:hypothetical protein AVEN_21142-1 [Araneus ventricosus]|uniref:Uncharacterized protein n=1 Tax=Araneus ventricosus TaxID=182803 RepID=A0A4Y2UKE0_ARAVE|nr:hypothetical protein AVEN_21142-1 [Araneus ventricosus]